ncbi:MAG TPA: bifunctional UDP-4-keto-pentose/UDP-xylose synthase [Planctomycetota bacterium]|jgi:nucleoside-diphosphate-sugar epimerase|nr:bifunctional UDP-4-keto-pentose/UDP-xylose synthase [Planctomycetota bacterium]
MTAPQKILIIGINGFIGSALTEALLAEKHHHLVGVDLRANRLEAYAKNTHLELHQKDILKSYDWLDKQVAKCDTVLPLAAIAQPGMYVTHPLKVFELDFESNLAVVKMCAKHKKRIVFPSTSEVYGMCPDEFFDEETSNFVLGPVSKQRWIYACSKQMLDRVIFAYGQQEGLAYTLFRPFNWVGPNLDQDSDGGGAARVVTQFLRNLQTGEPLRVVDGGKQRRCMTDIRDGIDALVRIVHNKNGAANGKIFNIGNPHNEISIADLAARVRELYCEFTGTAPAKAAPVIPESGDKFYGAGYQDVMRRKPAVENARKHLGWEPQYDLNTILRSTVEMYLKAHSGPGKPSSSSARTLAPAIGTATGKPSSRGKR